MQATIENRKSKGQGIVSEILSIIEEIPLGKHTTTVGLTQGNSQSTLKNTIRISVP